MKNKILILFFLASASIASAQNMQVLFGMDKLYQSSYLNPAYIPHNRVVVSMPSFYNNLSINGPAYADIFQKDGGSTVLNASSLLANLEPSNYFREDMEIQTLGLCLSVGPLGVQVYHKTRFNAFIEYPETLPSLIWEGNAQYLGETVDIGTSLFLHSRSEFGLGASLTLGGLNVGARVKYLNGIGHLHSLRHALSIYTDPTDYEITMNADYHIQSSNSLTLNGLNDLSLNFNLGDVNLNELFSRNNGIAFDLGVQWRMDKLEVSAAANDIGSIAFDTGIRNYSSSGTFSYDGLDISDVLGGQNVTLESAVDTLGQLLAFEEDASTFEYTLPASYYIMGKYKLTENWDLGVSYFHERFLDNPVNALSVSAGAGIGSIFRVRGAYTIRNKNFTNLGVGVSAKLAFLELYALTDNILVISNPLGARDFNILVGANFAISKKKKK